MVVAYAGASTTTSWLAPPVFASWPAIPEAQAGVAVGVAAAGPVLVVGEVVVVEAVVVVDGAVVVVTSRCRSADAERAGEEPQADVPSARASPRSVEKERARVTPHPPLVGCAGVKAFRRGGRWAGIIAMSMALAGVAGCAATTAAKSGGGVPRSSTTDVSVAPASSVPTTTVPPVFTSSVATVTADELGATWHAGCPVDPTQLRALQLTYWGFDGQVHTGTLVVNVAVVSAVVQVFSTLYSARFPISEMVPQSAFGGDDNAAAAADDTSGFNCRLAVSSGPPQWSMHAYGEAIDVNDVQNPYVDGSTVIPPTGSAYLDRSDVRPGMAVPGGTLVDAFVAVGWGWGANFAGTPDYQHFSINGR